jgi:hypothetical protein
VSTSRSFWSSPLQSWMASYFTTIWSLFTWMGAYWTFTSVFRAQWNHSLSLMTTRSPLSTFNGWSKDPRKRISYWNHPDRQLEIERGRRDRFSLYMCTNTMIKRSYIEVDCLLKIRMGLFVRCLKIGYFWEMMNLINSLMMCTLVMLKFSEKISGRLHWIYHIVKACYLGPGWLREVELMF